MDAVSIISPQPAAQAPRADAASRRKDDNFDAALDGATARVAADARDVGDDARAPDAAAAPSADSDLQADAVPVMIAAGPPPATPQPVVGAASASQQDGADAAAPAQGAQAVQNGQAAQAGQGAASAQPAQNAQSAAPGQPAQTLPAPGGDPAAQPEGETAAMQRSAGQTQGAQNPPANPAQSASASPQAAAQAAAAGQVQPAKAAGAEVDTQIKPGRGARAAQAAGEAPAAQGAATGADPARPAGAQAAVASAAQQNMAQSFTVVAQAADEAGADGAAPDARIANADAMAPRTEQAAKADVAAPAQAANAAPRTDAAAIVRLAQQIGQKAGEGARRFEIRMDPPDLGRIEVKLHIDRDNKAHAVLLAERADTLSDLSRASRALERALEDAGLKLANNGLEFGLKRDAPQDGRQDNGPRFAFGDGGETQTGAAASAARAPAGDEAMLSYGFRIARSARLAMRV